MLQTQPGVAGRPVGQRPLLLSWLVHTHGFFSRWDFLFPGICSPRAGVVAGPFTECVAVLLLALTPLVELRQQHLPQSYRWHSVLPVPVGPGWAPVSQELIYCLSFCTPAHPGTSCIYCHPNPPAPPAEAPQPLSFSVRPLAYFCSHILQNLRTFPV